MSPFICVFVLPVILAPSQTAASPVTSDLSCHGEVREAHVVVVMTGIEDVEVERGDGEEEKPTEEGGKLIDVITKMTLNCLIGSLPSLTSEGKMFFFFTTP